MLQPGPDDHHHDRLLHAGQRSQPAHRGAHTQPVLPGYWIVSASELEREITENAGPRARLL